MFKKHLSEIVYSCISIVTVVLVAICQVGGKGKLWFWIVGVLLLLISNVLLIFFKKRKETFYKYSVVAVVCVQLTLVFVAIFALTGVDKYLSDFDTIKQFVLDTGTFGVIVYVLLVILQVVVLPIPSVILVLVGTALYGATYAFVLTTLATIVGSIIAFALGKIFGKKFVLWLCGQENYEKYNSKIKHSGKYYLIVMFLLPIFPDDILCVLAGATKMSYKQFIVIVTLTRPVMIAFTTYFGSGQIIPYSGWGIPVWIGLGVLFVVVLLFVHKFGKKIEQNKDSTESEQKAVQDAT